MENLHRIAVAIPDSQKVNKRFSFRLKSDLREETSEFIRSKKIFVISNIEGNFNFFYKLLIKGKVIDKNFRWTFRDNHLVIVGDCFDAGKELTDCLWLIYSLEEKAKKEGGYVHFILGHHEIKNMNGGWRFVHPRYAYSKRGLATAIYDGNNQLWKWLRTKNIIEKIGDILFVHAGMAEEIVRQKLSVTCINSLARPYYNYDNTFTEPPLSLLFNKDTSPFMYRGYYLGTASEGHVDGTLKHFGVNTIVTGHTLVSRIDSYYNGKVINVNTDHASGNSEGLLINKHRFYRVDIHGKMERIK